MNAEKKVAAKAKKKPSAKTGGTHITGNIGLHYVCMRLSAVGLNVASTARNARGADALVYNRDCTKVKLVQIKTISAGGQVRAGKIGENVPGDFWVLVGDAKKIEHDGHPTCFILRGREVGEFRKPSNIRKNQGKPAYLNLAALPPNSRNAWGRIVRSLT